jgi:uncharacterized protein YbjQ (UPF0145 family)
MEIIITLICVSIPLMLGLIVGRTTEQRHIADLDAREQQIREAMVITQIKTPLSPVAGKTAPTLLMSDVVIASDYLKSWFAGWRGLFGGEIRSYQTLMDRARREAVLRLAEQARQQGFNALANIRLQTADIGGSTTNRQGPAMASIVGTATAYHSGLTVQSDVS